MNYFRAMVLLRVEALSKKEKGILTVTDASFVQQQLQKIAIAGETGSGKTTLLKMIAGLVQADSGKMFFEGKPLKGPADQLIPGHRGIAFLSQHFELRNNYWVHEILSYANELTEEQAALLYSICRIDHLLLRRTDQLSGGEKQRIALARLLIGAPRLLLLDEPFSNLDAVHRTVIKGVVDDISARLGTSCIMVSHDGPDILSWADTILVMQAGRIVQQGSPQEIYHHPINEYCAGLFGEYTLLNEKNAMAADAAVHLPSTQKTPLVRPEQVLINPKQGGTDAIVESSRFMGGYYAIELSSNNQLIKARSLYMLQQGEKVQWSITGPGLHRLQD